MIERMNWLSFHLHAGDWGSITGTYMYVADERCRKDSSTAKRLCDWSSGMTIINGNR